MSTIFYWCRCEGEQSDWYI